MTMIGLEDDSIMPLGTYKGRKMIDVPASWYLNFYKHIPRDRFNSDVFDYIEDIGINFFEQELKNEQKGIK